VSYSLTQFLGNRRLFAHKPTAVAAADIDGDGDVDVVTANRTTRSITILYNAGNGTYGAPTNISNGGRGPLDILLFDLNGDGNPDAIVSNVASKNISVLLGNGGGFGAPTTFATPPRPGALGIGDFNGDGFADLVVTNSGRNQISFLPGNGAGGFGAAVSTKVGGRRPSDIAVADFNNDGDLDVATANLNSKNISVLLGNGAGGFDAPQILRTEPHPSALTVEDFDNDGFIDIAVTHNIKRYVSVFMHDLTTVGNPFRNGITVNFEGTRRPNLVVASDFNGDGNPDLAFANGNGGIFTVALGDQRGEFSARPIDFTLGDTPFRRVAGIVLADVDNDGYLDIITANSFSHDITVMLRNS
jgi:hypothetical protein